MATILNAGALALSTVNNHGTFTHNSTAYSNAIVAEETVFIVVDSYTNITSVTVGGVALTNIQTPTATLITADAPNRNTLGLYGDARGVELANTGVDVVVVDNGVASNTYDVSPFLPPRNYAFVDIYIAQSDRPPASVLTGLAEDLYAGQIVYQRTVNGNDVVFDTAGVPNIAESVTEEITVLYDLLRDDGSVHSLNRTHIFNAGVIAQVMPNIFEFDATTITGLSDGAIVPAASITDTHSGNVAASATNVLYTADVGSGFPAISFAGDDNSFALFSAADIPDVQAAVQSSNFAFIAVSIALTEDSNTVFSIRDSGGRGVQWRHRQDQIGDNATSNFARGVGLNTPIIAGELHSDAYGTVGGLPNGELSRLNINGSFLEPVAGGANPTTANADLALGALFNGAFGIDGHLSYLVMYDSITPEEYMQEQIRIHNKFGIPLPWVSEPFIHLINGDSVPNVGASAGNSTAQLLAEIRGKTFGQYQDMSIPSADPEQLRILAPRDVDFWPNLLEKTIVETIMEYFNQQSDPDPAARTREYVAARKTANGTNLYLILGTSLDSNEDAAYDAGRDAYNASIAADIGQADQYWALHENTQIGVNGSWSNVNFLDTAHLNDTGHPIFAAEKNTAINAAVASGNIQTYSAPTLPQIDSGQSFSIPEDSVTGAVVGTLTFTAGTVQSIVLNTSDYVASNSGVVTAATVVSSTPQALLLTAIVTDEIGSSPATTFTINVTDVDSTVTPTAEDFTLSLLEGAGNNTSGAILGNLVTTNVTDTITLSGVNAGAFSINGVELSLVNPLSEGSYSAIYTVTNTDPDGVFTQSATGNISLTVTQASAVDLQPVLDQIAALSTDLAALRSIVDTNLNAPVGNIPTTLVDISSLATSTQVSGIPAAVEASLLNEGDGQQLINAIVAAIGNTNLDEVSVVAALRADLERPGGILEGTLQAADTRLNSLSNLDAPVSGVSSGSVDLSPVLSAISDTLQSDDARLDNIDAPISGVSVDLSPVLTAISSTLQSNDTRLDSLATIQAVTDQLTIESGEVRALVDKSGYTLTSENITAISTAVEASLLNEGDGQQLVNAIVAAIGNTNLDEVSIVSAIRSDLERVGGLLQSTGESVTNLGSPLQVNDVRINAIGTPLQQNSTAVSYLDAPISSKASVADVASIAATLTTLGSNLTALQTSTDNSLQNISEVESDVSNLFNRIFYRSAYFDINGNPSNRANAVREVFYAQDGTTVVATNEGRDASGNPAFGENIVEVVPV